jgi:hypothetical protein
MSLSTANELAKRMDILHHLHWQPRILLQQRLIRQRRSLGSGSEYGSGAGADLLRRLPASFLATRSRKLPVGKSFSFAFLYFVSQAVSFSLLV